MGKVLSGISEALGRISTYPRVLEDGVATKILREIVAAGSLEELLEGTQRLDARLGALRRTAPADRRRKPRARTVIRL